MSALRSGLLAVTTATVLAGSVLAGGAPASAATVAPAAATSTAVKTTVQPVNQIKLTPAQTRELRSLTDTPAKAALFYSNVEKAFGQFGTVGSGAVPGTTSSTQGMMKPNLAAGWSGDHFWLTMSYADVYNGGIYAAGVACRRYLPSWLCGVMTNMLSSWVSGYGWANNHGVWAAVYVSGWVTGGRW